MKRVLGQKGIYSGVLSGSGYIFIPNDITDRNLFISNCYNTCTVSVLTAEGQRFDKVEVNRSIFSDLDFPETVNDLGSLVFWVKHQKHNQPIVVAILNKKGEILGYQKGQFSIKKDSSTGIVSILGDSNNGNLFINVDSDEGGNIIINAKNSGKNNKVKINVDGNIETIASNYILQALEVLNIKIKNSLVSDKETIIKYIRDEGFSYIDQFNNQIIVNKDGLIYTNDKGTFEIDKDGKFSFSNDQYSIKDLITNLISEIEAIKTSTSIGLQPPVNVVNFTKIRTTELPKILK